MVQGNVLSQLENVKDDMRPWVYQLVKACLTKAIEENDDQAISAFLHVCNKNVLWFKSDIEQFDILRSLLEHSEHREYYVNAIHNAFTSVYGDVEGM